jgi:hypothetical protein
MTVHVDVALNGQQYTQRMYDCKLTQMVVQFETFCKYVSSPDCDDSCEYANDGECDGEWETNANCYGGTDCSDCDNYDEHTRKSETLLMISDAALAAH